VPALGELAAAPVQVDDEQHLVDLAAPLTKLVRNYVYRVG
jgi:hypothetical protein